MALHSTCHAALPQPFDAEPLDQFSRASLTGGPRRVSNEAGDRHGRSRMSPRAYPPSRQLPHHWRSDSLTHCLVCDWCLRFQPEHGKCTTLACDRRGRSMVGQCGGGLEQPSMQMAASASSDENAAFVEQLTTIARRHDTCIAFVATCHAASRAVGLFLSSTNASNASDRCACNSHSTYGLSHTLKICSLTNC